MYQFLIIAYLFTSHIRETPLRVFVGHGNEYNYFQEDREQRSYILRNRIIKTREQKILHSKKQDNKDKRTMILHSKKQDNKDKRTKILHS